MFADEILINHFRFQIIPEAIPHKVKQDWEPTVGRKQNGKALVIRKDALLLQDNLGP